MDWPDIVALLVLLTPLLMIVLTVLVLVPLAHLAPSAPTLARASLTCPSSGQRAHVAFVTVPGYRAAVDVDACSIHGDSPVVCDKACLPLATVVGTSSVMAPRFALLADGVATRDGRDAETEGDAPPAISAAGRAGSRSASAPRGCAVQASR